MIWAIISYIAAILSIYQFAVGGKNLIIKIRKGKRIESFGRLKVY